MGTAAAVLTAARWRLQHACTHLQLLKLCRPAQRALRHQLRLLEHHLPHVRAAEAQPLQLAHERDQPRARVLHVAAEQPAGVGSVMGVQA
jgi:hypothetical protein